MIEINFDLVWFFESYDNLKDFLNHWDHDKTYFKLFYGTDDVDYFLESTQLSNENIVQDYFDKHPKFKDGVFQIVANHYEDSEAIVIHELRMDILDMYLVKFHKDKLNKKFLSKYVAELV